MSKLQLLYEKLMKIAFIFSLLFFVIFLIDLFSAMVSGAFDCAGTTLCEIRDGYSFYSFTLYPLGIGTLVFLVAGRIFYSFAHKESDLLSVSDYKISLEVEVEDTISRDELYEKLGRKGRKNPNVEPIGVRVARNFKGLFASIGNFFSSIGDKLKSKVDSSKQKSTERKELKEETKRLEQEKKAKEEALNTHSKLNKTGLILKVAEATKLTQNDSRLFINTLFETIKERIIDNEEVKIAKFGKFSKVHIDKHTELDPDTEKEIQIEEHNDIEFVAFKQLISRISGITEIEEEPVVESEPESVVESEPEPVVEAEQETVVEVEPEPVVEVEPEPVVEVEPEPIVEAEPEPVVEVEPEPVVEVEPEPVVEVEPEPIVEVKPESDLKPVKPAKPKVVTKTKKQFIEMMDETTELSKNKANKFLKYFAEVVKEQLALREDVELTGIGFFTTIEMPAKEAVNPQTSEKIIVPAHHQVRLRFDDEFKDKMNE